VLTTNGFFLYKDEKSLDLQKPFITGISDAEEESDDCISAGYEVRQAN
jgi:hypothetical protein